MSAMSNARWLILIQAFRIGVQLLGLAVLTRLLPPSDYGLIAMAFTATNLASLLRDLGTSSAIIQKKVLTERIRSTVFWLHLSMGSALALALVSASGLLAGAFKQPALADILCLLALTFPMGGLSAVHLALLERESRFQTLARIEVVASSTALAVAIFSAYHGAGVYSFVWQSFTITALYVVQPWLSLKWHPRFIWDASEIRDLFSYSGNLSAFNLINFVARNADSMIIGRFLGPVALGSYSMAYKLMLFPLQNLSFVAGRAMFPVLSRQQDSNASVGALYQRAVAMVAAVSVPMMAGLFVLREPLSRIAFGPQWGDVPQVIAWLAPVGALQGIVSTTGSLFMAKGRTDTLFRLGLLSAVLMVAGFVLGLPGGVTGVAAFYALANLVSFVPSTLLACRLIDLPYTRFLGGLLPSLIGSAVMLPVLVLAHGQTHSLGDVATLLLSTAAGFLAYLVAFVLLFRRDLVELANALLGSGLSARLGLSRSAVRPTTWLFIDLAEDFGGHEVMLLRWIDEVQRQSNIQALLVCRHGSRLASVAAAHCQTIGISGPKAGLLGKLGFMMRLTRWLWRYQRIHRPELAVIAEGCLLAQRHGLYAARLVGLHTLLYVPLVSSFTSMNLPDAARLEQRVRRFYGKLPHAWLTITQPQAEEFRAWSGVGQPIFTLPNTVLPSLESGLLQRPNFATRSGPMRILVLGRLDAHQKGLDLLLDHLKRNPQHMGDFKVHFVGEGAYGEVLRRECEQHPALDELIELEAWASPLDVFHRFDALLMPSRFEGVPLVMLEAMACGLPVFASDLAGTRAYLPQSCLFAVGCLDQAFASLTRLRQSPTRAQRLSKRNLAVFRKLASGSAFLAAVEALTAQLQLAAQRR